MQPLTDTNNEPDSVSPAGNQRPGCLTWLIRGIAGLALLLVLLAVAGAIYQAVGANSDARNYPPPGRLENIGGRNLHLYCTGENADGRPTVILETLSGGLSPYWAWVQPEIAAVTRVCSYDRAGRGWSDPDPEQPTLQRTADDLRALLAAADVAPPFVLVGHSLGGIYVRKFAADHPDEVSGLVLVDASHPEQYVRYPEMLAESDSFSSTVGFFPAIARLGLFRSYFSTGGELDFQDLPDRQHDETAAFLSSPGHWRSVRDELIAAAGIYADAQTLDDLGALPLAVVTAGQNQITGWREMQAELAGLSSNSVQVTVDDAAHASLAFNEAHAKETSAAILAVVEAAATGRPLRDVMAR